jgi:glycosyltransferase involved in cell wall biosynthesis
MRVLLLNQAFPPEPAPSGALFSEIAEALRREGHEARLIDAKPPEFQNDHPALRVLAIFLGLMKALILAMVERRTDVVVSGSAPPGLVVAAMLVAFRHRARHLHWCLDLYPEVSVALREMNHPWLIAVIRFLMGWIYRSAKAVAAVDADMAALLAQYRVSAVECRPWVPALIYENMPFPAPPPEDTWTWIYSGNLGRGHDWQTLLSAQAELEARQVDATLIFQGGGSAWAAAKQRAEQLGLRRVVWRPYAPAAEVCHSLLRSHCLAATLVPEATGMIWPAKLALLLGLPRPVVFVGSKHSAIARLLGEHGQARVFVAGDFRAVADWVQELRASPMQVPLRDTLGAAAARNAGITWWKNAITNQCQRELAPA